MVLDDDEDDDDDEDEDEDEDDVGSIFWKKQNFQIKISSWVFGFIKIPSGFGVFNLKPPKIDVC